MRLRTGSDRDQLFFGTTEYGVYRASDAEKMTKLLADVYILHDPRHGPLDDLTAALERKEILTSPNSPGAGIMVAIILDNGAAIELL